MSIPAHGAERRRSPIPAWTRLLAAGIALAGLLAAGLALAGLLPARLPLGTARGTQPTKVDFGLPSRAGLVRVGAAPASFPVTLELGLVADQKGIANAARVSSDPSSSAYGNYPTLSEFARRLGADPARRHAVVDALSAMGIRGTVDATGLRVTAPTTIGRMEKLFATQWSLYATRSARTFVALSDGRPRIPKGLRGNVDVVAGTSPFLIRRPRVTQRRVEVTSRSLPLPIGGPYAGGMPTRTGTAGPSCLTSADPAALASPIGLFPDQLLTAYGIASLHRQSLQGQGVRLAIVGEAPTPLADVAVFRNCFGFAGPPLHIHGGADVQPILESSLDAMVASAVAPRLAGFDLWVRPLVDDQDDGDVGGFLQLLGAPLEAAKKGTQLPDVVSVSYGICEPQVAPFLAARTLVERLLASYASLGITVVVAAGDSGSSSCARGVPTADLTAADKTPRVSWPASSPWVLSVGGTNLTLNPDNSIASTGVWNDTSFPRPYRAVAAGGGGQSLFAPRPWWQPAASFARAGARLVPDLSAFADARPGYAIVCSAGVHGCGATQQPGPTVTYVGGTSAATPLVAGMIALWIQKAREHGLPRVGFVPPLLYAMAANFPTTFVDITLGGNAIYNVPCCQARHGFDLASGLGSPRADGIADHLPARGSSFPLDARSRILAASG
jgi:subtilase family serine protease